MIRFLLVRILQAIPVLLVMSMVTFIIINAPPGDYGDFIRNNMITQGNASFAAADAAAERYREDHGLNDPLVVQYVRWIGGIVTRGDFGWSFFYNRPVSEVVGVAHGGWSGAAADDAVQVAGGEVASLGGGDRVA